MGLTGRYEPGAIFAPGSKALVDASYRRAQARQGRPGRRAQAAQPEGQRAARTTPVWPGEGQYLYGVGGIPTANYITGPTYLLNWGITTTDKVDFTPRPHRGDRLHRDDPPARPHARAASCARYTL